MRVFLILVALAACGPAPREVNPKQATAPGIALFVADVSPQLTPEAQQVAANCGARAATREELQMLAGVQVMDAATTGMISEIMTRSIALACLDANGVVL